MQVYDAVEEAYNNGYAKGYEEATLKLNKNDKVRLKKIGELCKYQRKLCNLTVEQMAEIAGVPIKAIEKFEMGKLNNALILNAYIGTDTD